MSSEIYDLDHVVSWGWPWHGLATNGQLALPNGTTVPIPGADPLHGHCWIIKKPGQPEVTTTPAETAEGYTWHNYAVMSGVRHTIYGVDLGAAKWIYIDPDGKPWKAQIGGSASLFGVGLTPLQPPGTSQNVLVTPDVIIPGASSAFPIIRDIASHGRQVLLEMEAASSIPAERSPELGAALGVSAGIMPRIYTGATRPWYLLTISGVPPAATATCVALPRDTDWVADIDATSVNAPGTATVRVVTYVTISGEQTDVHDYSVSWHDWKTGAWVKPPPPDSDHSTTAFALSRDINPRLKQHVIIGYVFNAADAVGPVIYYQDAQIHDTGTATYGVRPEDRYTADQVGSTKRWVTVAGVSSEVLEFNWESSQEHYSFPGDDPTPIIYDPPMGTFYDSGRPLRYSNKLWGVSIFTDLAGATTERYSAPRGPDGGGTGTIDGDSLGIGPGPVASYHPVTGSVAFQAPSGGEVVHM